MCMAVRFGNFVHEADALFGDVGDVGAELRPGSHQGRRARHEEGKATRASGREETFPTERRSAGVAGTADPGRTG
jgi:hypothetical protein